MPIGDVQAVDSSLGSQYQCAVRREDRIGDEITQVGVEDPAWSAAEPVDAIECSHTSSLYEVDGAHRVYRCQIRQVGVTSLPVIQVYRSDPLSRKGDHRAFV